MGRKVVNSQGLTYQMQWVESQAETLPLAGRNMQQKYSCRNVVYYPCIQLDVLIKFFSLFCSLIKSQQLWFTIVYVHTCKLSLVKYILQNNYGSY